MKGGGLPKKGASWPKVEFLGRRLGSSTYRTRPRRTPLMLYLAIDQHAKQLTVSLRDEAGQVRLRHQVSTPPAKVREFFDELQELSQADGGFAVILEVCGFTNG